MSKRFRVAFSFAGEKRAFVSEVARILAECFGQERILYDRYHEAEFSCGDLAFLLSRLYAEEADLVVGVFCDDYLKKEWCGLEWRAIYSLLKKRAVQDVMLTRFGQVEPEGLFGLAGFSDLDTRSPEHLARLILERLALNEGRPRDFYVSTAAHASRSADSSVQSSDWPRLEDSLVLRVADHKEPQEAFRQLLSAEPPFQLLQLKGETQTGKTHLTKQFHTYAFSIQGLRCGRFDFKGSVDMDVEVEGFATQLERPIPAPGSLATRLAHIVTSLKENPCPTLLIFDTFEAAGEAEAWVTRSLLLAMIRCPWLRIVIAGQRTPNSFGEPWESRSSDLIRLGCPTPEEWFDYGISHQPDLTLDKVRWAHSSCEGKSSVLAQLLAPKK
jgi:hypothetical protein